MIEIEIIKSSEPTAIGVYKYSFDQINIGRSKKCDLIFLDALFPACYLTISANEKFLLVQSTPESPAYLINGKKTNGSFKIKSNDVITFGNHQLKVIDYNLSIKPIDLKPFEEKINEASEEVIAVLGYLEKKILEFDKAK
jgi:hypothetical protein